MGKKYTPEELDAMEGRPAKAQYTPEELDEAERAGKQPKMGIGEAVVRGAGQGLTLGFADELAGVGTVLGDKLSRLIHGTSDVPAGESYRRGRDESRASDDQAAKDQALAFHGTNLVTSILNPVGKFLPGVGAGVRGSKAVVNAGVRAATEGATFAAGQSRADVTRGETGKFLFDTGIGAVVGGTVGVVGAGVGEKVRKLADAKAGDLPDRILAEIAEGSSGLRTTPTAQKKLVRGVNNIVDEVVFGPDAKAVRAAYLGGAKDGIKKLQPIVGGVGAKLDDAYTKFEKAGVADIDVAAHWTALQQAAQDAAKAGKATVSKGLQHMAGQFEEMAKTAGGPIDLRALRQFTTDAQTQAAQAIGGFNPGVVKVLKDALAAEQTELMSSTLAAKATTPELAAALKVIKENNPRMNALLNIRQALEQRAYREQTTSPLQTAVKGIGAGGGIVAGLATGEGSIEERAGKALLYGAAGAAGQRAMRSIARAADRGITTMGINAQRAGVDPVKVGRNARAAGRGVASLVAGANAERTPGPSLPETEIDRLLRALRESAERQLRENR